MDFLIPFRVSLLCIAHQNPCMVYIYLYLPSTSTIHVGKYTSCMDCMGFFQTSGPSTKLLGVCQLSSSPDGLLHFGMKVMLVNHQSKGALYAPQSTCISFVDAFFRSNWQFVQKIFFMRMLESIGAILGNERLHEFIVHAYAVSVACRSTFFSHISQNLIQHFLEIYINFTKIGASNTGEVAPVSLQEC